MSHNHHNHHAMENHEHTTKSGDSCCPGSDAPASSGQHMIHHIMISMSFHFGTDETVLFNWWTFSTTSGLVCSMIGIFLMATLYEGLKHFREYLFWKSYNAIQYRSVQIPLEKRPNGPVSLFNGFKNCQRHSAIT